MKISELENGNIVVDGQTLVPATNKDIKKGQKVFWFDPEHRRNLNNIDEDEICSLWDEVWRKNGDIITLDNQTEVYLHELYVSI